MASQYTLNSYYQLLTKYPNSVVLKLWPRPAVAWYLGTDEKCKFSGPTPEPWDPARCRGSLGRVEQAPGDADTCPGLKISAADMPLLTPNSPSCTALNLLRKSKLQPHLTQPRSCSWYGGFQPSFSQASFGNALLPAPYTSEPFNFSTKPSVILFFY